VVHYPYSRAAAVVVVTYATHATQTTQEHFPDGKAAAEAVGRAAYDKGSLDNITVSCCVFEWQRERGRGVLRARREKQKQIAEQEEEIDMFG
jgi:hypothetical protein